MPTTPGLTRSNYFDALASTVFSLTTRVRIWGKPTRSGSIA